ncbi:MAG: protein kinase [Rhodobacterales bacterium]|nr:protein kinase [Rhodobacterales bacterium]
MAFVLAGVYTVGVDVDPANPIVLGPFQLEEPLAQGGMGEVWLARHRMSGEPVAIKLLTSKSAQKPKFRAAFRNEVGAVAALDHPHVTAVYDYGEVDAPAVQASLNHLREGTPWLAMELVAGGTLHDFSGRLNWEELRHVTRCLLDALAHAHARGVIHRDLKPGNVLVSWQEGELPRVRLTDFGLAQEVEDAGLTEEDHFYGGTPSYMAPEQFAGSWRDYGPWTDLYGLGCLVYCLVRGQPPFGPRATYAEKRNQHLTGIVPPLDAPFGVPDGFERWLLGLLAKDPALRFRRAADASWEFLQLDPPTSRGVNPPEPEAFDAQTLVLDTLVSSAPTATLSGVLERVFIDASLTLAAKDAKVPPLSEDWRGASGGTERIASSGLGLFGLRNIPLVDRTSERSALWSVLNKVGKTKQVHLVALTGAVGVGKSRLAEWFCERAHEVGAVSVLRAIHSPNTGHRQGLGPMIRRALRCQDLDYNGVLARVEAIFRATGVDHPDEWRALTEVIAPSSGAGAIRFRTSTERYTTIRRLLYGLSKERTVILYLDDVQWGIDALRFAQYVMTLASTRSFPLLVVMTGTDEALALRREEAKLLEELLDRENTLKLNIGPLPQTDRATLVEGLLGLDPQLAHRVQQRTGGNPQFVVQLVGDWVQRDLLVPAVNGYRIRPGADVQLPRDVRALWAGRVERFLLTRSASETRALELAATLGADLDPTEWHGVCARATRTSEGLEATPTSGLLDALFDQHLAICGSGGPERGRSFAHGMLRESLIERAASSGMLKSYHRVCAGFLNGRYRESARSDAWVAERLGRHLVAAGLTSQALAPLLRAADARALGGDYLIAESLLDARDLALTQGGIPDSDERVGEGWVLRQRIATGYGHYDVASYWVERLETAAVIHDWTEVRVRAMCLRGEAERLAGRYHASLQTLTVAEQEAVQHGIPLLIADARYLFATVLTEHGDLEEGEKWIRLALADFKREDAGVGYARCTQSLGQLITETGRHPEAAAILQTAELQFEELGDRWGMASSINSQGDVARYRGRLTEAEGCYRRARGLFRAIGSASWIFADYNLGLIQLQRRDYVNAKAAFERALPQFTAQGHRRALTDALVGLAACAAADNKWLVYDDYLNEAATSFRATASADEDSARLLSMAGDTAMSKGEESRAVVAYRLARGQWQILGRQQEVVNLDQFLARIRIDR